MKTNDVMNYTNELLGQLSVIQEDSGELWFIGGQVTRMLGHKNPKRALQDIPSEWKKTIKYDKFKSDIIDKIVVPCEGTINNMTRRVTLISEGALYYLVSRGQSDTSKYFNQWLFGEVVPNIRRRGMYIKEDLLNDNKRLRSVIHSYRREVAEKSIQLAELKAIQKNNDLYGDTDYCTDDEIEKGYTRLCHFKK